MPPGPEENYEVGLRNIAREPLQGKAFGDFIPCKLVPICFHTVLCFVLPFGNIGTVPASRATILIFKFFGIVLYHFINHDILPSARFVLLEFSSKNLKQNVAG